MPGKKKRRWINSVSVICAAVLFINAMTAFLPQDLRVIVILAEMFNLVVLPFQIDKLTNRFSNIIYVWEMAAPVAAIVTLIAVSIFG